MSVYTIPIDPDYIFWFAIIGLVAITLILTMRTWGNALYVMSKHRHITSFVIVCGLLGTFIVLKQEEFKHDLASMYHANLQTNDNGEARYQIRQCKDFVSASLDGTLTDQDHKRTFKAGFIKVKTGSDWDFCARTFGLNFWKHDISINGQNGGRLLCDAYARASYRSGEVDSWCSTVFAEDRKI